MARKRARDHWIPDVCPICGGLLSGFYVFEKETVEQAPLLDSEECNCGELASLRMAMGRVWSVSRAAALDAFAHEVERQEERLAQLRKVKEPPTE